MRRGRVDKDVVIERLGGVVLVGAFYVRKVELDVRVGIGLVVAVLVGVADVATDSVSEN